MLKEAFVAGGLAIATAAGFAVTQSNSEAEVWDCYCAGGELHGSDRDFIGSAPSEAEGRALCRRHQNQRGEHSGTCTCEQR